MALKLKNPHSVLAALETRPRDVLDVRLQSAKTSPAWNEVAALAKQHGVPVRSEFARETGGRRRSKRQDDGGGRTGAGEATVKEREGVSLDELFAGAAERADGRGLWLALDRLQDPHNVGAIFRSAAFFGVQGIVLTRDQSAPLSATVYDIASGGLEGVPFAQPANLSRALELAKEAGLWVLGSSEHADRDLADVERDRPWLLVLGNEEKGLRRLTLEKCDEVCRLSPQGSVGSLNVSVAAGVMIAALTGSM